MSSRLNTELLSGLLFILIGSLFLIGSLDLSYGTLRRIGPGRFPAMVAVGVIIMGVIIGLKGLKLGAAGETLRINPSRLVVIIASIVIFGLTVRGAGLLISVALCSLIASFASRPFRPITMGLYGLFLGGACSAAFIIGLGMPVRIIGPWFGY
ncbi:tripartite tricarboxylate transporter TctB family protein [Agrobacterium sp.]|uniref:tripartite tricarboxylate transporter TctB family protein n=1 Tax=Agrobacterium sp. TaxID=361 RepID=UPI0028A8C44B|nr:tripartite tricarboxylate transporter TctB family protein [Agrobacterium sp.]